MTAGYKLNKKKGLPVLSKYKVDFFIFYFNVHAFDLIQIKQTGIYPSKFAILVRKINFWDVFNLDYEMQLNVYEVIISKMIQFA